MLFDQDIVEDDNQSLKDIVAKYFVNHFHAPDIDPHPHPSTLEHNFDLDLFNINGSLHDFKSMSNHKIKDLEAPFYKSRIQKPTVRLL